MSNLSVCRICLAGGNIRLNAVTNTLQQEMFEKFTGAKLVTEDGRPLTLCYLCGAQLRRFTIFYNMSQKAEKYFAALLRDASPETTVIENNMHNLALSPVYSLTLTDPMLMRGKAIVKEEPLGDVSNASSLVEAKHDDTEDPVIDSGVPDNKMYFEMIDTKDTVYKEIADRGIINGIIANNEENDQNEIIVAIFTENNETLHEDMEVNINVNADKNYNGLNADNQETNEIIADNINISNEVADQRITNGVNADKEIAELTDTEDNADNTEIDTIAILDDEQEFPCDECEKRFNFAHQLQFHKRLHVRKTKGNICGKCGKKFIRTSSLAIHLMKVHNKVHNKNKMEKDTKVKIKKREKNKDKVFECRKCTIKFTNETDLLKHVISHSSPQVVIEKVLITELTKCKKIDFNSKNTEAIQNTRTSPRLAKCKKIKH